MSDQWAREIPEGDDKERWVCQKCDFIRYENPKIIAGVVATFEDRVLLVRRAIEPRDGYWTLPAGYLELGESPDEGALRETWEEARARVTLDGLLALYSIRHISQVQMFYRAVMSSAECAPGPECREARLFAWDEIPRKELAFPTVSWALEHFAASKDAPLAQPFTNPPDAEEMIVR